MPICLYCDREKLKEEFSKEHILPKAIGGNITPINPFVIHNVCERCNKLSGLYIDAPFIRNWFTNNNRADNARKFINLSADTILPLHYMGVLKSVKYGNKICENWLGPTGDCIYHFHESYPKELDVPPLIGAPLTPFRNKIDYGFAFIFIRSNNPEWHPVILKSFTEHFKNSILYLGNGPTPKILGFSDITSKLCSIHEKLKGMLSKNKFHEIEFTIEINYGDRFLAKIALGIGSIILNESFKQSRSSDLLRKLMWERKAEEREKIPVFRTNFLEKSAGINSLVKILKWEGGHSIALINEGENLVLYTNFYEFQSAIVVITDEAKHWKGKINGLGIIFVIVPGFKKAVGPLSIGEFIAHKTLNNYKNPELLNLEREMSKFEKPQPFDLED